MWPFPFLFAITEVKMNWTEAYFVRHKQAWLFLVFDPNDTQFTEKKSKGTKNNTQRK